MSYRFGLEQMTLYGWCIDVMHSIHNVCRKLFKDMHKQSYIECIISLPMRIAVGQGRYGVKDAFSISASTIQPL